ncbi:hypothetical protein HP567_028960 [Brevibacillus sp. M2.1A]|uniref:SMODS domain-containing nucleotidyltransferase n=1 Tax=Brevibacillus sp. M2.1A TaxID=2738980 RepID=UPI00156B89E7|nr:nucleotidyltransferase [Brevibacillus sp. M2.1A]MCC8438569.1 hypothetical protein [Brevibacillus sp. M2.1A]
MTGHEYLESQLDAEKFDTSEEPEIKEKRDEVEELLRGEYGSKIISFKYSGSIAKHTAIKSSKDMDLAVHFKHDSFDTLKNMYESVSDFLEKHYTIIDQRVSIGLDGLNVDVVPGRRIDTEDTTNNDVNLYRTDTETRIKTNIETHKKHIRDSSARNEIKLMKIWRERWALKFKSFAIELLVIKAMESFSGSGLDNKVKHVLQYIKDEVESINLIDPANSNNNVADIIDSSRKTLFKTTAEYCLTLLEEAGEDNDSKVAAWKQVFKDTSSDSTNNSRGTTAPAFGIIVKETQDSGRQPDRRHG